MENLLFLAFLWSLEGIKQVIFKLDFPIYQINLNFDFAFDMFFNQVAMFRANFNM